MKKESNNNYIIYSTKFGKYFKADNLKTFKKIKLDLARGRMPFDSKNEENIKLNDVDVDVAKVYEKIIELAKEDKGKAVDEYSKEVLVLVAKDKNVYNETNKTKLDILNTIYNFYLFGYIQTSDMYDVAGELKKAEIKNVAKQFNIEIRQDDTELQIVEKIQEYKK